MQVTVKYGTNNELRKEYAGTPTLQTVLNDARAALGYGTNVEGHIGSVPQPATMPLQNGMVISVHDKACQKAIGEIRVG